MSGMKVMRFNHLGVCGNCGQVGSYEWLDHIFLCQICTSLEVVELLEAVRDTLEEFSEWNLDETPLRRLNEAANKLTGLKRTEAPVAHCLQ
jgi:hypothetical protein